MYKRIFASIGIAGILIIGAAAFASPASALTVADLQAQIQELLAKVAELTRQLNAQNNQQTISNSNTIDATNALTIAPRHRICGALYRSLSQGVAGDDVVSLQEFLRNEGYFSANATGYYGPLTANAVARWQAANDVSAVGVVGPQTRERIRIWCGGDGGGTGDGRFGASPQRGSAPLTVTFKTNVQLSNPNFIADAGDYKIVFGDGTEHRFSCTSSNGFCPGPHSVRHTYTQNGTYTAQLVHYGYFGLPAPRASRQAGIPDPSGLPENTVGSVTIYVGDVVACTKEYRPVCGQKEVVCITAPCNPVQQTYGNRCEMNADGATFLYEGQCRVDSGNPENDPRCKAWYDGCNNCSRSTPGGLAICTLRACIQKAPAYCTEYFDGTGANRPPVISSFSGPTTLNLNQTGTWTVRASDPENGSLSYRVSWGDEGVFPSMTASGASETFTQMTTFTHTYNVAGTYTVTVVVRDSAGQEAKTSSTVRVGPTYSYPVACTADAYQCPNGSWVGRTGPNCEFVCPSGY